MQDCLVSSSSNPLSLIVPIAIILMIILRRQGVRQGAALDLGPKERLRPLLMVWIDPLLVFLFSGEMLWTIVHRNVMHATAAVVGGLLGSVVGIIRGRIVFIKAVPQHKSVVIKRNAIEYGLLIVLLALRITQDAITKHHSGIVIVILGGLIALAIIESIARAGALTQRYRNAKPFELLAEKAGPTSDL